MQQSSNAITWYFLVPHVAVHDVTSPVGLHEDYLSFLQLFLSAAHNKASVEVGVSSCCGGKGAAAAHTREQEIKADQSNGLSRQNCCGSSAGCRCGGECTCETGCACKKGKQSKL